MEESYKLQKRIEMMKYVRKQIIKKQESIEA